MRCSGQTCLVLLAALTSCGGDASAPTAAPALQALQLAALAGDTADPEESIFKSFTVGAEDPGWRVRSKVRDLAPLPFTGKDPDPRRALHIGSPEGMRIDLPGPFEDAQFNLVELQLAGRAGLDFFIALRHKNKIKLRSATVHIEPRGEVQRVLLELPPAGVAGQKYDELSIIFGVNCFEVWLFEAHLIHRPPALWLGAPEHEEHGILVGEEQRPAQSLLPRRPLVGRSALPVAQGSVLSFDVGLPRVLRKAAEPAAVELTISAQGAPDLHWSTALDTASGATPAWQSVEFSLDSFVGKRIAVRLELTGDGAHAAAIANPAVRRVAADAPSVLLITSDTHRADHLGFTGGSAATPNIDALALSGLSFVRCSSTTNTTNPAHIALMTGVHPRDTRVVDNHTPLAEHAPTLAEAFRAAGWETWAVNSAAHLTAERSGLGQGFARYSAPLSGQRDSSESLAILNDWLSSERPRRVPLFIWLHIFDAHSPYDPPASDLRPYWPADRDAFDTSLPEPLEWQVPRWKKGTRDLQYLVALYRGEVSYLDRQLGSLFEHQRLRDGLIAFTADHGESLLAHGVFFDHRELYPDTLDVPLVLRGAACTQYAAPGQKIDRPVSLIDLGRTLLDLAQVDATDFPGRNLFDESARDAPQFALSADALSASIRLWPWFLVLHLEPHRANRGSELKPLHSTELYQLSSDPSCLADQTLAEPRRAQSLRRLLIDWLGDARTMGWNVKQRVFDRDGLDQLAAMGYSTNTDDDGERAWIAAECDCEQCVRFAR